MANAKKKYNTPEGVAKYPWLTAPDTRFNEAGEYSVSLILPEDDPKTQDLIEKINNVLEEGRKTLKGAKAKANPDSLGYEPEYTDDGDETGNIIFKFKAKTGFTSKKTKEWVRMDPPKIFDSKLQPLASGTEIWGGSTMVVNFTPSFYDLGKNIGVTLRLNAVKIIQLNNGSTGQTAESFGFEESEGYTQASEMREYDEEEYEEPEVTTEDDKDDF